MPNIEKEEINALKEKLKDVLQSYIAKDSGIYHIYALFELAADLTANTNKNEYFFTVYDEVEAHYFKGDKIPVSDYATWVNVDAKKLRIALHETKSERANIGAGIISGHLSLAILPDSNDKESAFILQAREIKQEA